MIEESTEEPIDDQEAHEEEEPGKARALTLHVLRMFETRMDAAGIALHHGTRAFTYHRGVVIAAARGFGVDDLSWGSGNTSLAAGETWRNSSGNLTVKVGSLAGARDKS